MRNYITWMPNFAKVSFAAIPHFTIYQIPRNHLCPILRVCLATVGGVAPRGRAKLLLEKALHVHLRKRVKMWCIVKVLTY